MFGSSDTSGIMAASVLDLGLGGDLASQQKSVTNKLKKKRVKGESPTMAADELGLQ
jgi:hypothetical protein